MNAERALVIERLPHHPQIGPGHIAVERGYFDELQAAHAAMVAQGWTYEPKPAVVAHDAPPQIERVDLMLPYVEPSDPGTQRKPRWAVAVVKGQA